MSHAESAMKKSSTDGKGEGEPKSPTQNQPEQSYAQVVTGTPKERANEDKQSFNTKSMATPMAKMTTPTPSKSGVYNPYKMKRLAKFQSTRMDSVTQLTELIASYMEILIEHESNPTTQEWISKWNNWTNKGITDENITITNLASIVEFPNDKFKSIKAIGVHILESLPVLTKFLVIPNLTRDQDPIIRHTKPVPMTVSQKKKSADTTSQQIVTETLNEQPSNSKEKNETKLDSIDTPTITNKSDKIDNNVGSTMDNNPFSVLTLDDNSSILGVSADALSEESNSTVAKAINFKDNKADLTSDNTTKDVLHNLKSTEISFDKQYNKILTSLAIMPR